MPTSQPDCKFGVWTKLLQKHSSGSDPMFSADRADSMRKILDVCISFDLQPVVPGMPVVRFVLTFSW